MSDRDVAPRELQRIARHHGQHLNAATRVRRDALAGRQDPGQVERIAGVDGERLVRLDSAQRAQLLHRVGQRVLLAVETAHEASAVDLAARLRRATHGQGASASADDGLEELADVQEEFESGMNDDLNVPRGLSALHKLRSLVLEERLGVSAAAQALRFLERANGVLGVIQMEEELLDADIQSRIDAREAARKSRNFKESDRIRDELASQGIVLEDTPKGVIWKRKS